MTKTIVDRLYRKIRQDIIECELSPGLSLSEAEFGRRYEGSRTPVREACRRLENEGLICIVPFRGYSIAPLSIAEFQDLEELQLMVEPSIAALAAERATERQLDEMAALATYQYKVGDAESYRQFLQTNHQLHALIATSTRNLQMAELVGNVHVRLMRFFYLGIRLDAYGPALVNEHLNLVEAIRRRDAEGARQKAREHILNAINRSATLLMGALRFGEAVFEPGLNRDSSYVPILLQKPERKKRRRAAAEKLVHQTETFAVPPFSAGPATTRDSDFSDTEDI